MCPSLCAQCAHTRKIAVCAHFSVIRPLPGNLAKLTKDAFASYARQTLGDTQNAPHSPHSAEQRPTRANGQLARATHPPHIEGWPARGLPSRPGPSTQHQETTMAIGSDIFAAAVHTPDFSRGQCAGRTELFDPPETSRGSKPTPAQRQVQRQAVQLCLKCPVRQDCRAWFYSLATEERPAGVIAGMIIQPRRYDQGARTQPARARLRARARARAKVRQARNVA